MDEDRRRFSPPAVGGSSLLVIFAVLCLIIFALLSLSTVQADVRLGDAAEASVKGYYEADTEAESVLAQLRNGVVPDGVEITTTEVAASQTPSAPAASDSVAAGAATGVSTGAPAEASAPVATAQTQTTVASYVCPISETQELRVSVEFHGGLGNDYTITQWQAVTTAERSVDTDLNVYGK